MDDSDEFRECFSLPGVTLPTGYFFGASAATGDLAGESFSNKTTESRSEMIVVEKF